LAKETNLVAVYPPVSLRQTLAQFAHLVGRPGMIEDVKEQMNFPGVGMAKISSTEGPARSLAKEAEHLL
jgi:hypothetical protein